MDEYHLNTETNEQLISIGKIITTKAHIFANAVKNCNNKPIVNQTRPNFKTHFTTAQINYKKYMPNNAAKFHGYQNQANAVEVVLHGSDKCQESESKIHAQAEDQHIISEYQSNQANEEAYEFQKSKANASQQTSKTDIQYLINTIYSLKAQMNNCIRDVNMGRRRGS